MTPAEVVLVLCVTFANRSHACTQAEQKYYAQQLPWKKNMLVDDHVKYIFVLKHTAVSACVVATFGTREWRRCCRLILYHACARRAVHGV